MANIRDLIRELADKWINPVYAKRFDASVQVKDLIIYAFVTGVPESKDTKMLREAWKRLENGALTGEYP